MKSNPLHVGLEGAARLEAMSLASYLMNSREPVEQSCGAMLFAD